MINETDNGFALEEVRLQFELESSICKLLVRNNIVNLVLRSGVIHRISLDSPEDIIIIKIGLKMGSLIEDCWIDNNGYHLIVRSSKNDYYYIPQSSTQYYQLSKLRGLNINSISFFEDCVTAQFTGPIILSTRNSLILEYSIDAMKEKYLKSLSKNQYSIMNINNELISSQNGVFTYSVNFFTLDKNLLSFRTKIPEEPATNVSVFQSLMKSEPTKLHLTGLTNISAYGKPVSYIHDSKLCVSNSVNVSSTSSKLLEVDVHYKVLSYILTNYYILILTKDNILVILDQLTFAQLHQIDLNTLKIKPVGLSYDEGNCTYWIYTKKSIHEIVINSEKTGILDSLIRQNMFAEAKRVVQIGSGDRERLNLIMKYEGNALLKKREYISAIDVLADTDESVDRVALKLMECEDKSILRKYLGKKLASLSSTLRAQKLVLTSWIVELYTQELNKFDNTFVDNSNITDEKATCVSDQNNALINEFHHFLTENKSIVDRDTVYDILYKHSRKNDLLFFANLVLDSKYVLQYYITNQCWEESLNTLSMNDDPELVYSSATVLICNFPSKTVNTWMSLSNKLDNVKLIPALTIYNRTIATAQGIPIENNEAIRFLKFLIYERRFIDKFILNTFYAILISYPNTDNEEIIIEHLEKYQLSRKKSSRSPHVLNIDMMSRLCLKYNKIKTLIYMYSMDGKYRQALKLALDNDLIENAIHVAEMSDVTDKEKKFLWLQISKKLINKVVSNQDYVWQNKDKLFKEIFKRFGEKSEHGGIYIVLQYLMKKCELLKINDLLPLFPDFIVIDNFKDALIEALERLSKDVNYMSNEMNETLTEAKKLHDSINDFQSDNFQVVKPYESCELCHTILTIRKFIVFPCNHSFHQDCLVKKLLNSNDYKIKNNIYQLQQQIKQNSHNSHVMHKLKGDIDTLLSKSCCLCSDMKIGEIDQPLIKTGDKDIDSWIL